jgi:hypothetical protein
MATRQYMAGRKKYARPQAVLFADQPPVFIENGQPSPAYPGGIEASSNYGNTSILGNSFIILSDHNRNPINMSFTRYENKQRMVNAQLRSFYVNEKMTIDLSWNMLPSRAYSTKPDFSQSTGLADIVRSANIDHDDNPETPTQTKEITSSGSKYFPDQEYTVDGGAGGAEILAWYKSHRGPFWVYLSYDNFASTGYADSNYGNLANYTDFYFVYITSFNYSVEKRGSNNHDMWNISLTLEEV